MHTEMYIYIYEGFHKWGIPKMNGLFHGKSYEIGSCVRKPPYTLWLFNIAMENGPFIGGLPLKNGDFPCLC
jgi:hypothetical protein